MTDEKTVPCRVCGTPNPPGAKACSSCGVSFRQGESLEGVESLLQDLLKPVPAVPAKSKGADSLDLDAEIVDELLDSLLVEESAGEIIRVECPLCGHEVAADASRCDQCGSQFVDVALGPPQEAARAVPPPPPPDDEPGPAARRDIPVAATTTEASEPKWTALSARLADIVVVGTAGALVAAFIGLRLYSFSSVSVDPTALGIFLGIAGAGMLAGFLLFRVSTSFLVQGDRLVKAGRYPEAIASYDRAIRMGHRPSNAWTSKGVAMKRLGRTEDALRCQETAVRLDPENEIAWCNLGDLHFRLGDFPKALDAYDRALKIRSRYAIAWNNKGAALARMDRFEEARACHDRAVELQPRYVAAWLNRGEVFARLGDREEAQRCLERARTLGA